MEIRAKIEGISNFAGKNRKYIYIFLAVLPILLAGIFIFRDITTYKGGTQDAELSEAYRKIENLENVRRVYLEQVAELRAELDALAGQNDKKMKEAGNYAYKQKMAVSDADIDAAWRDFLSGVRERNRNRNDE